MNQRLNAPAPYDEDDAPPTCARCGGEMEGGELIAQGSDRNWLHRTEGPMQAGSTLIAWVCAECGWVDFYIADLDGFFQD